MKLLRSTQPETWSGFGLGRWGNLHAELDQLFRAPFESLAAATAGEGRWMPAIDVFEENDNYVVTAELPGLNKDDIDVSLHEGVLTLSGERKSEEINDDAGYYRAERAYGSFSRTVNLPSPVNEKKIAAAYKDGVLTVTMPKAEEAKPKQIDVKIS